MLSGTSLVALALVALLLLQPHIAAAQSCGSDHEACSEGTYCSTVGVCLSCALCRIAANSIDDCSVCGDEPALEATKEPSSGASCRSHSGCTAGLEYCDNHNECFACRGCIIVGDGVDGTCPGWCYLQPGNGGGVVSQHGESPVSSFSEDTNTSDAGQPSGALVIFLIVAVVVFVLLVATVVVFRGRWRGQRKRIQRVLDMHGKAEDMRQRSFRDDSRRQTANSDADGFEMDDAFSGMGTESLA